MNLQAISESKLKAFNIGTMNIGKKGLSKKEQEELKRKVSIISSLILFLVLLSGLISLINN